MLSEAHHPYASFSNMSTVSSMAQATLSKSASTTTATAQASSSMDRHEFLFNTSSHTPPNPSCFNYSTTNSSYNTPLYTQTNPHITRYLITEPIKSSLLFPTTPSSQMHNDLSYQPISYTNQVSQG